MFESRKRPYLKDDQIETPAISTNDTHVHKKARKETNASARRSLFVRSLPAVATSQALTELFSQSYPLKHATVVLDTETKQSKGYGFVTFADAEDCQRAQEEFNGQNFLGRKMRIEIAEPRSRIVSQKTGMEETVRSTVSAEAAATKKARTEQMATDRKPPKLIIRNLPWSVKTPEQLAQLFQKFGKVKHSTLPKVKDTQAGFGFVVMRGRKNAEKALATINGTLVDGRTIAVDWAVDKGVWEGQKKLEEQAEEAKEEDHGSNPKEGKENDSGNEDDDVANFFKNFGDKLESEDESDDADKDQDLEANPDEGVGEEVDEALYETESESEVDDAPLQKVMITDNSTTLFIRNLPFTTLDAGLKEHFEQFGPVRYARVVMDRTTDRPKGTAFVCFFKVEDADACFRGAPRGGPTGANAITSKTQHSILQDENADLTGSYTLEGRVLQIVKAVEKETAVKLAEDGTSFRHSQDKDKRKLYLLSEGTVAAGTPLYESLAPSEVKMREDSAKQRKKLVQGNPTLHLSLTRLSIRNLPRNIGSKELKALAREAVVGFARDVKDGKRSQLSKEEESRGGEDMKSAEKQRKVKGKGIVRQAKIVFEGREGAKVTEQSGAGRSRGYGFIEYSSHRWALMGLRWLNGHALIGDSGKKQRMIVEFAIENAQVVARRKETEEKARKRSLEVVAARERGDTVPKTGKVLSKDTLMAKTRKGTKGKMGKPQFKKGFDKVENATKAAGKPEPASKKGAKESKAKTALPVEDDTKLAKRAQIIQKKRTMRRNRKQGA